jgi:hypothetical protein
VTVAGATEATEDVVQGQPGTERNRSDPALRRPLRCVGEPVLLVDRDHELERVVQEVGDVIEDLLFAQALGHEVELEVGQISDATVEQLRGARRGPLGEIGLFDEPDVDTSNRQIEGCSCADDPASDDQRVEAPVRLQALDVVGPIPGCGDCRCHDLIVPMGGTHPKPGCVWWAVSGGHPPKARMRVVGGVGWAPTQSPDACGGRCLGGHPPKARMRVVGGVGWAPIDGSSDATRRSGPSAGVVGSEDDRSPLLLLDSGADASAREHRRGTGGTRLRSPTTRESRAIAAIAIDPTDLDSYHLGIAHVARSREG